MILDGKGGELFAAESLKGIVVKVHVCQLNVLALERIQIDTEAVILAGYFNPAGVEVLDGVVCSVVSEFQFVGFGAESEGEKLMSETNAENRNLAEQSVYGLNSVRDRRGVAGAVAEKYPVGFSCQHLLGRGVSGHHEDLAAVRTKQAQDILLDSEIKRNDLVLFLVRVCVLIEDVHHALVPCTRLFDRDVFNDVSADQAWVLPEFLFEGGDAELCGRDDAPHCSLGANVPDELSGVDAFETDDVICP